MDTLVDTAGGSWHAGLWADLPDFWATLVHMCAGQNEQDTPPAAPVPIAVVQEVWRLGVERGPTGGGS